MAKCKYRDSTAIHKHMRAIWQVIFDELLTKRKNKKKNLYTKNTYSYVLRLLLSIVTAGIEALASGNEFSCAYVKSATYELSHVLYCETLKKTVQGLSTKGAEC